MNQVKYIILFLPFLFGLPTSVCAQKQNNIWYFGHHAGLDFNTSPPTAIEGDLEAFEGTACISDPAGNLLFYSNGATVWDKNHNIMPNGDSLAGGVSSTQVLIVPLPNSCSLYYLFTTEDHNSDGGLAYSIIDMCRNNGLGDVVDSGKNILLADSTTEKITAVRHVNETDIWIITHTLYSDEFLSFLLTETGVNLSPVVSSIGSQYYQGGHIGPAKASHDGTKIASAATILHICELFDFNSVTGELTNFYNLNELIGNQSSVYGVEFSPDDRLLYLSNLFAISALHQIDLETKEVILLNSAEDNFHFGSLQMGYDRKIYIARNDSSFLDVIHQPNKIGNLSQYEEAGILLAPGTNSFIGLPNFAPFSFFPDSNSFISLSNDTSLCIGESLILKVDVPQKCKPVTLLWNDGSTGTEINANQSGTYWVDIQSPCISFRDSIKVDFISCLPFVFYDMEACKAVMSEGTNMDYTEFTPAYPNILTCSEVSANNAFRSPPQENKHSCTPGIAGSIAICISSYNSCTYSPGHQASLVIEVMINPHSDSIVRLTGLEFYEKAPVNYTWIHGGSGPNNYPTRYGIRILKNDLEIFRDDDIHTGNDWNLESFDFMGIDEFEVEENTVFRIELLPYCPVGNGADVSAWDLDEIKIFGGCVPVEVIKPVIEGVFFTKQDKSIPNVEVRLANNDSFSGMDTRNTDGTGYYLFDELDLEESYFLKGYKNDTALNGVSTLDLIHILKHLLGKQPFASLDQYIAGDANNDGIVSAIDLLELRKLILGIYSEFPRNTSWRFGPLTQDMNGTNISDFKELHTIEYLYQDTQVVNFIGIKIGDLNGDAQLASGSYDIQSRSEDAFKLIIQDKVLKKGETYILDVKASEALKINGMQFALGFDDLEIISLIGGTLPFSDENYTISNDGILRLSCAFNEPVHISDDEVLFRIELKSEKDGPVSERIAVKRTMLNPEAYTEDLEVINMDLIFQKDVLNPESGILLKIEPNPVSDEAKIHFYLSQAGQAEIRFIDLSGRVLHQIKRSFQAGENMERIQMNELPSANGIIYCQLVSTYFTVVGRFMKVN